MSNIKNAFENNKALICYLTAGDPSLEKTAEYIIAMSDAGADLIEIGIPFSDPVAEGEVIQRANIRALKNDISIDDIFSMVYNVRKKTSIPLVFLTYVNPVFQYGYENFFAKCAHCGISGIILPDMPYEEQGEIVTIAKQHDVDVITLVAPTSQQRIETIAKNATGFLYLVSSLGVTGVRTEITTDLPAIIQHVQSITQTPVAVGFGIATKEQAKNMADIADGVIIGSAIVKIIEAHGEKAAAPLTQYIQEIKAYMNA